MADPSSDVAKLQGHLDLLRNEHRKLLARNSELERAVSAGGSAPNSFATQLVKAAADLFDKSLYSDILVVADDKKIHAHRFVLAARGKWTAEPLADAEVIEFTTSYPVALGAAPLRRGGQLRPSHPPCAARRGVGSPAPRAPSQGARVKARNVVYVSNSATTTSTV